MVKAPSLLSLLLLGSAVLTTASEVAAQLAVPSGISQGGINVVPPTKGETQNLSVTNGSRTALSVGNTTSFGASTNLTLSSGLTGVSRTVLIPSSVTISSKIGDNALQQTKIDISNLSAQGQSGSITPVGSSVSGGTIDLQEGTQYASGNAYIEGMGASVSLGIDPANIGAPGEASFFSTVHPNIKDQAACLPTNTEPCSYVVNELVSGNAGANASLSTTTNIDINANSFVNTFAQSF